MNNGQNLTNSS